LARYPVDVRENPATPSELDAFEREFGNLPPDVRWFLEAHGGGAVGSEWLDGVRKLRSSQLKYQQESGPTGWSMTNVIIVGWDGWGNPIGVERETGEVLIEDHTHGGVHVEAPSFLVYLQKLLLGNRA
jgi:SMI1/KNR4 family protein SUKH-1